MDEWYTPKEIIGSLGEFDLDPASSKEAYQLNQSAQRIYTKEENGLIRQWEGRIWLNPPYGYPAIKEFLMRMAEHNNGIALVFTKIDAHWFHDIVLNKAMAAKFLYERIRFLRPDGTPGLQPRNGSMFLAYGENNVRVLRENHLKGKFVLL